MTFLPASAIALVLLAGGAIVAIWLGYPAVMLLLARIAGRPATPALPTDPLAYPTVTVIVATRDRAPLVAERIANLLECDYPAGKLDVIVVLDSAGADATPLQLSGIDPRVRVVVGDAPGGKASSLNAGVRTARGDLLVMADSQQTFARDTIRQLVAALGDERFGAVSGALTLGGSGGMLSPMHVYWSLEKRLREAEAALHSAIGVTGAVYAMRRALWTDLPTGTLLDDVYVPMSLVLRGHRVGFEPAAVATDRRVFDASAEQGRKARTLTGVLQLCQLLPAVLSPARNPVWVQFALHKLARLLTPLLLAVATVAFVVLLAAVAVHSPRITLSTMFGIALLIAAVPPLRRVAVIGWRWGFSTQLAIVRALVNGARGRWTVWTRPK